MKKRLISLALSLCLLFALCVPASASAAGALQRVKTYSGQFTDVPGSVWYTDYVKIAYEYGLMNGKSSTKFTPDGSLSVAEAITLASRLHSFYHGGTGTFPSGSPWYRPYVDYALANKIIFSEPAGLYDTPITRQDFAVLMSNALPDSALPAINTIPDGQIPDVTYDPMGDALTALIDAGVVAYNNNTIMLAYIFGENAGGASADLAAYEAIYRLYRAGVLTGNDAAGTYTPQANIQRSAVAAILSRIAVPSMRKTLTLQPKTVNLVPMKKLANLSSLRKNASDAQLAQAYEAARKIVEPLAGLSREAQLCGIALALRDLTDRSIDYSMSDPHYNDPYGFFVLHSASCAGCTRATGLCLNMLGIPYEHVNPNAYTHQWTRIDMGGGVYWICDAYGLYCGPEPAPYQHPNV